MVTISLHDEQPWEAQGNKPGWMMVLPLGEAELGPPAQSIAAETACAQARCPSGGGQPGSSASSPASAWYRLFPRQPSVNLVMTSTQVYRFFHLVARVLEVFP